MARELHRRSPSSGGSSGSDRGSGNPTYSLPQSCPQPKGAYQITFSKMSGTCGELSSRVVIFEAGDDGCVITYQKGDPAGDGCHLEEQGSCHQPDESYDYTMVANVPGDMQQITGTVSISAKAGNQSCNSMYQMTMTKS